MHDCFTLHIAYDIISQSKEYPLVWIYLYSNICIDDIWPQIVPLRTSWAFAGQYLSPSKARMFYKKQIFMGITQRKIVFKNKA